MDSRTSQIRLFVHLLFFGLDTAAVFLNYNAIGTKNIQMFGKILQSSTIIGLIKCARKCEALSSCHEINFHKSQLLCEFVSEQTTGTVAREGWLYVSNVEWLKKKKLSLGMEHNVCSADEMKVKLSSGNVHCLKQDRPVDCEDNLIKSGDRKGGVYFISPQQTSLTFDVFCDFETIGGPWTVIQARVDRTVRFDRLWNDYKQGFGDMIGSFWLGNDNIHTLLSTSICRLRVDMEYFDRTKCSAEYSSFSVAGENDKYRLTVTGYNGNAGDSLSWHSGHAFSTMDRDNDLDERNCAGIYHGGWWFTNMCYRSYLNGPYSYSEIWPQPYNAISWIDKGTCRNKGDYDSLRKVSMKVKKNLDK